MEPSEVLDRVRAERCALRLTIDRLDELACRALGMEPHPGAYPGAAQGTALDLARELAVNLAALTRQLHAELDLEDRLLLPALREVDPRGDWSAHWVEQHHHVQLTELASILQAAVDPDTTIGATAEAVLRVTRILRSDMAREDQAILRADLLRDDVIGIDVDAG